MIARLSFKNLTGRLGRTAALVLLAAFLAFSIFGGSLMILSLQRGLDGLEARLGADIIVVPSSARSKFNVNDLLLQGNPGYFYMNKSYADQVAAREGVEQVSCQLYLASVSAGCCSVPVQIIGFDPATDFTILPWARETYRGEIGRGDILVGSDVNVPQDGILRFYNVDCRVVAQLSKTGSSLDTAVYGNQQTIQALIAASQERGLNQYNQIDTDKVVSAVLIKVKNGYDVEDVKDDVNIHVRKVVAVRASHMISGIADSLAGMSRLITLFIAAVWALCLAVMAVAFAMIMNERKKEFAVLRVLGASRGRLAGLVMSEAAAVNLLGALAGIALALLAVLPFSAAIEKGLGLPFVIPDVGRVLLLAAAALGACLAAGAAVSALSAVRVSRVDPSLMIREEN